MRKIVLSAIAAFLLVSCPSFAQNALPGLSDSVDLSPFYNWKTIETRHFRVTYPSELQGIARTTAGYLEEAHDLLSPKLKWSPKHKTQVLVIDNSDMANGMATPVGRLGLILMVTPPDNWFSTYSYDNWLRNLVIHEYTHFLNMDATTGILWETLRVLFGDVFLPNSIWPRWMIEGLAVYMESRFTTGGRGRSSFYEMVLRAAVEENKLDSDSFITLDKINGDNPYFPGGETAYLFGYYLMNQVANESRNKENEDRLGEMSLRSSRRIPFFINGNLENITGKDWYNFWDQFVQETKERIGKTLARVKTKPLTPYEKLTTEGFEALGVAASPDGRLLAYTHDSIDRRSGLYLRDIQTGATTRIEDKLMGVGLAFTPDSRNLLYSAVNRRSQYNLLSDLLVRDLERQSTYQLTKSLRARDPDVSRNGHSVVFTVTKSGTTGISIARLTQNGDRLALSEIRELYRPEALGRTSNPKFNSDGTKVIFSFHPLASSREDILEVDTTTLQSKVLVSNGAYNRFPTFDTFGNLHFVSDLSGIDNIYLFSSGKIKRASNFSTGVWFPAFGPNGMYASVFSTNGWDLAKIKITKPTSEIPTDELSTQKPQPAPQPIIDKQSSDNSKEIKTSEKYYSLFPSIWPRQWTPILLASGSGLYAGGSVLGFDAVDRHRYLAGFAYDSYTKKTDVLAIYTNRSLGPLLTFSAENRTTETLSSSNTLLSFIRKAEFGASIAYPFRWTYSSLTPSFSINASRESLFAPLQSSEAIAKSRYVPNSDVLLTFSNTESSRLAISPEGGRTAKLGSRVYIDSGIETVKGIIFDKEYIRVTKHSVAVPSFRGMWVSRTSSNFLSSNAVLSGRSASIFDPFPNDSFDELALRGYPGATIAAKTVLFPSLEYRFPIARIFRGWETNPVFLENLYGFVFFDLAYIPRKVGGIALSSTGSGIKLSTELFIRVPLIWSLEYHHGLNENYGGQGEVFFTLNLGAFSF